MFLRGSVEYRKRGWSRSNSKAQLHSPTSPNSLDLVAATWRMESIVRDSDSGSGDEDEFFDCQGDYSENISVISVFVCLYFVFIFIVI